jgi:endo-1,4-beta-xylanase
MSLSVEKVLGESTESRPSMTQRIQALMEYMKQADELDAKKKESAPPESTGDASSAGTDTADGAGDGGDTSEADSTESAGDGGEAEKTDSSGASDAADLVQMFLDQQMQKLFGNNANSQNNGASSAAQSSPSVPPSGEPPACSACDGSGMANSVNAPKAVAEASNDASGLGAEGSNADPFGFTPDPEGLKGNKSGSDSSGSSSDPFGLSSGPEGLGAGGADSANKSDASQGKELDKLLDQLFGKGFMELLRELSDLLKPDDKEGPGEGEGSPPPSDSGGSGSPCSGGSPDSSGSPSGSPDSSGSPPPSEGNGSSGPSSSPPSSGGGSNGSGGTSGANPPTGRNGKPPGQEDPDPTDIRNFPSGQNPPDTTPSGGGSSGPAGASPLGPTGPISGDSFKANAAKTGMYAGAAVEMNQIDDPKFTAAVKSQFNSVTAENAMKWGELAKKGYGEADKFVDWAQKNDLKVRGHALVWHEQTPGDLNGMSAGQLKDAATKHIDDTVKHFGDKVKTWDVVNETFSDSGEGGFRKSGKDSKGSPFNDKMDGQEFLDTAFKAARKAGGPNKELVLNDYNVESKNAKSDSMYNAVKSMKERGIPIDAVGFQAHMKAGQDVSSMAANIKRFKDLGVNVQITELDVAGGTKEQKAETIRQVFDAAKKGGASGVTMWGVTDSHSWIGNDPGLLYDQSMNLKQDMLGALR